MQDHKSESKSGSDTAKTGLVLKEWQWSFKLVHDRTALPHYGTARSLNWKYEFQTFNKYNLKSPKS